MNETEKPDVSMLDGPSPRNEGFVEVRVLAGGRTIVAAVLIDRSVAIVDPPSRDVENAVREFVGKFKREQRVLLHRTIVAARLRSASPVGAVVGSPTVDSMGGLRFRVAIEGDEFQMTISVALVPSTTRGADAKGCSEAAFSAAYDSCLSYMEEHGDELASRGFDASELRKQQAAADMWLLARNQ